MFGLGNLPNQYPNTMNFNPQLANDFMSWYYNNIGQNNANRIRRVNPAFIGELGMKAGSTGISMADLYAMNQKISQRDIPNPNKAGIGNMPGGFGGFSESEIKPFEGGQWVNGQWVPQSQINKTPGFVSTQQFNEQLQYPISQGAGQMAGQAINYLQQRRR